MTDETDFEPFSLEEQREFDNWSAARARVIAFFEKRHLAVSGGFANPILVADDMLDALLIEVETRTFAVLHPDCIDAFRRHLEEIPRYAVTLAVLSDRSDQKDWPRMGLTLFKGMIGDGLKRDRLPAPYNTYFYTNSRPDNRPDLPFV